MSLIRLDKKSGLSPLIALIALCMIFQGCSDEKDETGPKNTYSQNFGTVNLLLTIENHSNGWGRADCLMCHPLINIPRHTGREENQCMGCHGENGSGIGNNLCLVCHDEIISNRQHNRHLGMFNSSQSITSDNRESFIGAIESFHNSLNKTPLIKGNKLNPPDIKSGKTLDEFSFKSSADDLAYFDHCNICHTGSGVGTNNHINGYVEVVLSEAYGGTWDGDSCSGTYCHGSGEPQWHNSAEFTCADCHRYGGGSEIDPVSGRHGVHIEDGEFNCNVCHSTYPSTHLDFEFDNPDNIVPDGGTYTDATPDGYSEDGSSGSCSGMTSPCHGGEAPWQPGFACGTCHGISSSVPPESGSHFIHAGSDGYAYSCSVCHHGFSYGQDTHLNGKADIGFDPDSLAGNNNPSYSDSLCSNIYCHGVGERSLPAGGNNTPTWGDPTTAYCGSCHGATTDTTPTSGKHELHVGMLSFSCSTCHYATIEVDFKGNMPNVQLDVVFNPTAQPDASYSFGETPNTGTCMSMTCHNDRSWE